MYFKTHLSTIHRIMKIKYVFLCQVGWCDDLTFANRLGTMYYHHNPLYSRSYARYYYQ